MQVTGPWLGARRARGSRNAGYGAIHRWWLLSTLQGRSLGRALPATDSQLSDLSRSPDAPAITLIDALGSLTMRMSVVDNAVNRQVLGG